MSHFGGVYVFDHNLVESELILMKSGALWVHCRGLALADVGCDPPSCNSWRASRDFFVR